MAGRVFVKVNDLREITFNRCHRRDLATGSGEEWDESESVAT